MLKKTLFLILIFAVVYHAQTTDYKVNNFLVLGPLKAIPPIINDGNKTDVKTLFSDGDNIEPVLKILLEREKCDILPSNFLENVSRNSNTFYYASFYIETTSFVSGSLKVSSRLPYRVYLGSEGKKSNIDEPDIDTSISKSVTIPLDLETGKTFFIIKVLSLAIAEGERELKVIFSTPKESVAVVNITTDPIHTTSFSRLLDDPKIQGASISPNGEFSAINISQRNTSKATAERSILIFDNNTKKLARTLSVSGFNWVKDDTYSYTSSGNNTNSIHLSSIKDAEVKTVLSGIENFSSYSFSEDGTRLLYTVYKEVSDFENGAKRYRGIQDRWDGWRNKYKTFMYDMKTSISSVLTNFDDKLQVEGISSDNSQLLLSRSDYDLKTRPYSYTDYFLYNFKSLKLDSLFRLFDVGGVSFSRDGKTLYISGGPALFGDLGVATPKEMIPNDYNTLLYSYEIESKKTACLTKNFDPTVTSFYVNDKENEIYLLTTDKSYKNVYFSDKPESFKKIDLPIKSVENLDFDRNSNFALVSGSNPDYPDRVFLYDSKNEKATLLYDPNAESYKDIVSGKYEEFSFTSSKGRTIEGAVFFPPNYDANKKYPCIVNYYGGTSPVSNTFEGRYPKNIWTANGYIVFILQPSGAVGYGQEFSAYHVNDWGETVAQEIIEGTETLLKRFPSIDSKRLGCIGASYGGFMTMSLITKTNLFAAAISHAGISSLSNYWGAGYWGLVYSATATANSFPWNRKDIYIDKSPLFSADKVNTPLLLLHGNDDHNVPPGESMSFYTALKLLGKDVEFIEIDKQDHHILEYDKRKHWSKTILAYFDKYLKNDNGWWKFLYDESSK